jgi:hypothetical protein
MTGDHGSEQASLRQTEERVDALAGERDELLGALAKMKSAMTLEADEHRRHRQAELDQLQRTASALREKNDELARYAASLEQALAVERSRRAGLENEVQSLQAQFEEFSALVELLGKLLKEME